MAQKTTKTILVLDDDQDDHLILSIALDNIGEKFTLLDCYDFAEALEKLDTAELLPDLIIIDLQLTKTDGIECLQSLKKHARYQDIPVLMCSGIRTDAYEALAKQHGAFGFIEKSGDVEAFSIALKEAISKIYNIKSRP